MNTSDNKAVFFKREALKRIVEAFDKGTLERSAYRIPFDVIPQESKSAVRCCIYKERAVFRARTLAALGCSVEKDDEATSLNEKKHCSVKIFLKLLLPFWELPAKDV